VALAAIAISWTVSLALPAVDAAGSTLTGFEVLLQGWRGVRAAVPAWLANPLFLIALVLSARRRAAAAALVASLAVALSLTSFVAREIAAASGVAVPPVRLHAGFYVWLGAQLALVAVALAARRRRRAGSGIIGHR
jgi:hypothetical protein